MKTVNEVSKSSLKGPEERREFESLFFHSETTFTVTNSAITNPCFYENY